MAVSFVHNDPVVFQHPKLFNPERWLGNNVNDLDNSLVAFSRGTRACVGIK